MAKSAKLKTPAATVEIPQTRDDVAEAIAAIGRAQRECARIEATMGDEIAAVRKRFEAQAEPHKSKITALQEGVQTWCEAHRDALTNGGKVKTAVFTTGEVRWRLPPASVALRKIEEVLKALKRKNLGRFIRTKEEVNKEAILLEPAAISGIPGISIVQAEEFVIVPHEAELAEVAA